MERLRRKLMAFVVALTASMALMSLPVMAKTNNNAASFSSTTLTYEETGVNVNAPTLVLGTDYESINVHAGAVLKNSVPSDVVLVTAVADNSNVTVSANGDNNFTLIGKTASNKATTVSFTYHISGNEAARQKNAPIWKKTRDKVVKLKVKVVDNKETVSMNTDVDKWNISVNNITGLKVDAESVETVDIGLQTLSVNSYTITTSEAKNAKGSPVYTIPVEVPVTAASSTKLTFFTDNKGVAPFTGKLNKEKTAFVGTIKVNRNAFATNEEGVAEALIGVGVKGTATKYGKSTIYAKADYVKLYVIPDGKTKKVQSASATVNGQKATNANLVIGAGETEKEVELGAVYSANGGKVTVNWDEVKDESSSLGYTVIPDGNNGATLTVYKPLKNIKLNGEVKSEKGTAGKPIKLTVTATKRVDEVKASKELTISVPKATNVGNAAGSTYYGTNLRSMYVNGEKEKVRTFYYLSPEKAIKESFTVSACKTPGYEYDLSNVTLMAVKDVSDSELNNLSTMTIAQNNKKTKSLDYTVTMTVKPKKKTWTTTDEELVIYQIAAKDSYDKVSQSYGVGQYVAISMSPKAAAGQDVKATITTDDGVSGNTILATGATKGLKVTVTPDVPYTVVSRDENVVVVENSDGSYSILGESAGEADIEVYVAGNKDAAAKLHVYVVGFKELENATIYPGKTATLGTISSINGATATVSVNIAEADKKYVSVVKGDASLSGNQATDIIVSANKVKDGKDTKVKVSVNAIFNIGGQTLPLASSAEVTVIPYVVTINGPYEVEAGDPAFVPVVKVEGDADAAVNKNIVLSVNSAGKYKGFADVISGNSISGNFAGEGFVEATYTDVKGNTYKATTQLRVIDSTGGKSFRGKTVISFNAIQEEDAEIRDLNSTAKGNKDSIFKAYKRFRNNLTKIPKEAGTVDFIVVISGNHTVSNDSAEPSVSADAAERVEGAEAEPAEAAAEPEAPAEEAVEEPANEAVVSENAAEIEEAVSVNAADAEAVVSENEASNEPEAPEAAEETAETEENAEAEIQETVEKAEAEVPEAAEETAGIEEGDVAPLSVNYVVVSGNVVTETVSEGAIKEYLDKNFDQDDDIHMKVILGTSDRTMPNLLGLADQVINGVTDSIKKKLTINFSDGEDISVDNVQLQKGLYVVGNESFVTSGTGDQTLVIYEGKLNFDDMSDKPVARMIKRIIDRDKNREKKIIAGITYYDENGKPTPIPEKQ